MLSQLLLRHVDNTYHGYKLSLWLFAVVVFMKVIMSLNSIFDGCGYFRRWNPGGHIHARLRTDDRF